MSPLPLGILAAAGAAGGVQVTYRLQTLGGAADDSATDIVIDPADNVYIGGMTSSVGQGGDDLLLAKYDSSGIIQWQRVLGGSGVELMYDLSIDSTDNIYVTGYTESTGAGSRDLLLAKYNSSGTIQWQRVLGLGSNDEGHSIAFDSANNVYVSGRTNTNDLILIKYNSSGTIQWQKGITGGGTDRGHGVKVDSTDNVYVSGYQTAVGEGSYESLLIKYDTSGNIQWQRILGGSGDDRSLEIGIDSADNVYVVGIATSQSAGGFDSLIAKYNPSGTLQWQRTLGGANNELGYHIVFDSADNVYVTGYTESTGAGSRDAFLAKYNSSGTIQWQRVLGGSGAEIGRSLGIDSAYNLYVAGYTGSTGVGSNDFLLAVLPNDGSLTGTYVLNGVNIVYQASTLTATTSSLTANTASLTAVTPSLTAATSNLTSASASLTEHRVDL